MITDSTVQTSVLDYTVAAIISRQSINCMIHIIFDEYVITRMVCVIRYAFLLLYGIHVDDGVIH